MIHLTLLKILKNHFQTLSNYFFVLFIIIVVVLAIIGFVSFFVIKSQRKYYKLQKEIYNRNIQKITEKDEKINVNIKNHKFKMAQIQEKSTEDLGNDANEINTKNEIKRVVFQSTDISYMINSK